MKQNRFLFFGAVLLALQSFGQSGYLNLSSPHNAVRTHMENLQQGSYNDSLAAQVFNPKERTLSEAKILAVRLKRALDGKGIYIYMDEIPKSSNYFDSTGRKHKFVLLEAYPRIFLLRHEDGNWYYSDSSVDAINKLYKETFRFGTGKLMNLLPKLGTQKVMGLYMYQYVAILILAFISTLVYKIFAFLTERVIRKLLHTSGYKGETSEKYLWLLARPASVFFIILLLILFTPALQLPVLYSQYIITALRVTLPLSGTIVVYRMVNIVAIYLSRMALKTESTLDDQLVPLLRKALKTFVVIIGTLFILDNLDVPILPLLTGLSIGGLAFALAAQDTIKNFFGSIMIFIDKPFQVGDWVTSGDIDGTVEEVGFRSSRIRTFSNSLVYIPNGKLADSTIDNHGLRQYRRFYTKLSITYDTPPELIEIFVNGLRKIVETHPKTRKDGYHIYFNDMAASSLNVLFYIFFEVPTWAEELKARHEVLLEVMNLAKELGINFAFPTQTLHVENLPGQLPLSPTYMSPENATQKLGNFFKEK
ncbi:MAG: mechanosensitive ion channel family protein [Cyclobacteriaceae bacterium]